MCWLHLELLEHQAARLFDREIDTRMAEIIDRRLYHAQARISQALIALAKVRRLNLPVLINQVNVGTQVNGAVRVSAG